MILAYDIIPTMEEGHGGYEHHHSPEYQSTDEFSFVLREEEEGESHDTVCFDKSSQHDKEGCPKVFLFLNQIVCQQDGSGNGDVELLHEEGCQHLMGTEPKDEYLLIFRKLRLTDGPVKKEGQGDTP